MTRGLGGLVSVLGHSLSAQRPGAPGSPPLRAPKKRAWRRRGTPWKASLDGVPYRVRYVVADAETYRRTYIIVANPMLWFVQHYFGDWRGTRTSASGRWKPGARVIRP